MIIADKIIGNSISLRSVAENDAEFIIALRNKPDILKFMPGLKVTKAEQEFWITKQRTDNTSYYFIIEDKNEEKLGTISVYDIEDKHAETGRFCSLGNFVQNTEALILFYDFIFHELKLDYIIAWVFSDNRNILAMNSQIGFEWNENEAETNGRRYYIGILKLSRYEDKIQGFRRKIKLLN